LNCVIEAWSNYEGELRGFLVHQLHDHPLAEDLLQDVFLKALAEGSQAIHLCDLEGMNQADYASSLGLSLAGAKSRVQRARKRLKQHLRNVCQVRFDETGKICCFVPRGQGGK